MCLRNKDSYKLIYGDTKMSVRKIEPPKKGKATRALKGKKSSRKMQKFAKARRNLTPWGKTALGRYAHNPDARRILERRRQLLVNTMLSQAICTQEWEQVQFSYEDIHRMYKENEEFRNILDSGNYMFYKCRLVLKKRSAFFLENGILTLNSDIADFDKMYCLRVVHKRIPQNHTIEAVVYPGNEEAQKVPVQATGFVEVLSFHRATAEQSLTKTDQKRFSKFLDYYKKSGGGGDSGNTFGEMLTMHMNRMNYKDAHMSDLTGISDKTIQRYRLDEVHPQLSYIVAICIALRLFPKWSEDMIAVAGYSLRKIMPDQAYLYLLNTQFEKGDVAYCNRFLQECNQKPLTEKFE